MKTIRIPRLVLLSSLVLSAPLTGAQSLVEGYANGSGGIVKDGFGGCVRTLMWTQERAVEGCDGFVPRRTAAAAPAARPAPAAAPAVVAAPPPAPVFTPVPAPAPIAAAPIAAPQPVVRTVNLKSDALFAVSSAELKGEAQPGIDGLVRRVRSLKRLQSIEVVGHTDSTGSVQYNQRLSERRAESVKAALVKGGVDAGLITTSGMGPRSPIAENKTPQGRAKNRRVAITLTGNE